MSLHSQTRDLADALTAQSPDPRSVKRQLEMIHWVETSESHVQQSGIRPLLDQLSCSGRFPESVQLEAKRVLARWDRGTYAPPDRVKGKRATAPGTHGFVVGDCWPNRKTMFKEGCHGTLQSGIHGDSKYGAYSIVANGVYDNRDKGDTIWYAGTDPNSPGEASGYTKRLIRSSSTGNPVRVIRGARGAGLTFEPLSPPRGFRYDGLYTVQEYRPPAPVTGVEPTEGTYEFLLVRLEDQPPILYKDDDMRPDNETLAQWYARGLT